MWKSKGYFWHFSLRFSDANNKTSGINTINSIWQNLCVGGGWYTAPLFNTFCTLPLFYSLLSNSVFTFLLRFPGLKNIFLWTKILSHLRSHVWFLKVPCLRASLVLGISHILAAHLFICTPCESIGSLRTRFCQSCRPL